MVQDWLSGGMEFMYMYAFCDELAVYIYMPVLSSSWSLLVICHCRGSLSNSCHCVLLIGSEEINFGIHLHVLYSHNQIFEY